MSIKTRGLVFATFFINCIVVGLLIASLATEHWIESGAKMQNSAKSTGTVHFGLFSGKKELDVGIGKRSRKIDIPATLRSEPTFMSYWLWLGTFVGTGLGLFSSAIGGIASVMKSASPQKKHGTMCLLFFSNGASGTLFLIYLFIRFSRLIFLFFAALSQFLAFICWIGEFYGYLKENVLISEDRERWHTTNLSDFGHSFYFVLLGILFVIVNIVILFIVLMIEKRERRPVRQEPVDEKTAGAIMLY